MNLYLKQAWHILKENPLISSISVAGTALSIAAIMILAYVIQIRLSNYPPEMHRDRMLYAYMTQVETPNGKNRGGMSAEVVKECFYSLKTPETVAANMSDHRPISLQGKRLYKEYNRRSTDHNFWKIFDFTFIDGKPFTESDFQSGIKTAVISESLARELFQNIQVVGQTIVIDFTDFRICGVVKDVSNQANDASADLWVPYSSNELLMNSRTDGGLSGAFSVLILAKRAVDFPSIREELDMRLAQFNEGLNGNKVDFMYGPVTRKDILMGSNGFAEVDIAGFITQTGGLLLFLLLVPVLNLTGVTQTSVQRRKGEMGIRKAFGATDRRLMKQILTENLLISFMGGVLGFGLSFFLFFAFKDFLLFNPILQKEMFLQPGTFVLAIFFILLINVLSAVIPAYRISKQKIVNSLNEEI